ncbi:MULTISPECIES: RluA family pseudouridine synthase [unclassified Caballeronia]|uniref:RluA family pseudouridine synthase n=2 Tax=Caballeronia TaxID=1827195 RepID=UPI00285B757D|nr:MULTISPECIES: RluA family pseudouridine synthase [unclassified Caballeronia]MDR5771710.1 RluA family pseudouridine synthase [Caballeronia sp. LZ002]MDR5847145.1 RluA family pseudouridine synthase [Caballeronia sp. LZ003]
MTRSSTRRTKDQLKDYSRSAKPDDAASTDSDAHAPDAGTPHRGKEARHRNEEAPREARVPDELAGERLDKVLAKIFPEFSRSRLQGWIEEGRVLVDGASAKVRQPVPLGATIALVPDLLPEQLAFTPEPVPLHIVYEDETLVVINKPAGMVVHPAAGNWSGTLLNGLLHRYGDAAAGLPRAGIVHRLDKETSGLMVVARTLEAQTDLVRQLQARTVKRRYVAFVWGRMPDDGTIDAPIGRDSRDRTRMAVVQGASGKPARTHFRTIDRTQWNGQPVSAIHCDLETGRTHQIRVHCAASGHPLLGDPVYGHIRGRRSVTPLPDGFARQALHAWRLGLVHPATGKQVHWRADVPEDLVKLATELGFGRDDEVELDEDDDFPQVYEMDDGEDWDDEYDDEEGEHDADDEDDEA